jgi:hypothetical protein
MRPRDIATWRLANQRISTATCQTPAEVVAHLTAMQAQDYRGALWSIGLRMQDATAAAVEQAIADRLIVRTWPMRRTLHFVAADDVRWMLGLLAPRMISGMAGRLRRLELDAAALKRSGAVIVKALRGSGPLTRRQLYDVLSRARLAPTGQRGIHILCHLSMEGLLCQTGHAGTQSSFALLDEWIPTSRTLARDEALAELARRYFQSHGPATIHDLCWWSGLTVADAKAAIEMISSGFVRETIGANVYIIPRDQPATPPGLHLLPGFDEFLLGYTDRSAALDPADAQKVVPGNNGMFMATIVAGCRVVGTWKPSTIVTPTPFRPLTPRESRAYRVGAARYAAFTETRDSTPGSARRARSARPIAPHRD